MTKTTPVAVVGVSALFPGSSDAGGFWKDILAGRDLITDVPPTHWLIDDYYDPDPKAEDKTYCKRGAFLGDIEFSPMKFGIPPNTIESTDTAQLLALIVAQQVLEDAAGGDFQDMDRERISVILGVASATELVVHMASRLQRPLWRNALRQSGLPEDQVVEICQRIADHYVPWQESTFPGLLGNVVAGRIANRLDLGGTNCVVDAACASSLAALDIGLNELYVGQSDLVITGGTDTLNDILMYMCFSKTTALSHSGDCRPFSEQADGTMMGEGIGMVALKRLADAERDGDRIYAVIQGIGSSSDGKAKSIYAPVSKGQAKALRRAYDAAGYEPDTVELVEAHGTSTKAGDLAEFQGLQMVFEGEHKRAPWCALGSVKSQIGHTKASAGAAGLFKAVMALHHKILPPTLKVERPNPKLDIHESPFYLNTETRPWIRDSRHPRRASVSSFGFGGTNFHVALEEYTGEGQRAHRVRPFTRELLVLSDDSPEALARHCDGLREAAQTPGILAFLAEQSQANFDATKPARAAIVARDEADLQAKLEGLRSHLVSKPQAEYHSPKGAFYKLGAEAGGIAFLFPGQGSQYVGMGAQLAMHAAPVRERWDDIASVALSPDEGLQALQSVVFPQPVFCDEDRQAQRQTLTQTEWAQPAIGATSAAMLALLDELGVKASCVGGHSFGEVTALYAAGVLDLEGFLQAARRRGECMAQASEIKGAMLAVSAPIAQVKEAMAQWQLPEDAVVIANHNSPSQVVLSGTPGGIAEAEERLLEMKIPAKRLQVSTAFHSPLVQDACAPFLESLAEIKFRKAQLPVYANASASVYPKTPAAIRKRLAEQLGQPVRFVEEIQAMYDSGVRTFLEVGPHGVLTQLVGACLEGQPHLAVSMDRKNKDGIAMLWQALGRLAVEGVAIDFSALSAGYAPSVDPRSIKAPTFSITINGANYNKPYPPPEGPDGIAPPNPSRPEEDDELPTQAGLPSALSIPQPSSPGASVAPLPVGKAPAAAPAFRPTSAAAVPKAPSNGISTSHTRNGLSPKGGWITPTYTGRNGMDHKSNNRPPAPGQTGVSVHAPPRVYAPAEQLSWISAYQEMQRQTMEAHTSFQRMMADTHVAFLRTTETAFMGLTHMLTGERPPAMAALPIPSASAPAIESRPAASYAPAPMAIPTPQAHAPWPSAPVAAPQASIAPMEPTKTVEMPAFSAPATPAPVVMQAPAPAPVMAPAPPIATPAPPSAAKATTPVAPVAAAPAADASDVDLVEIMLEVVSEKTGYPVEMLELSMELESELGIDSIKRVEILSAMQERVPSLPEVDTGQMASLQTLEEIVNTMSQASGEGSAAEEGQASPFELSPIKRFVLRAVDAAPTGLALSGIYQCKRVVVTPSQPGSGKKARALAKAVVKGLEERGVSAEIATELPEDADGVIYLGGLRKLKERQEAIDCNREAFDIACQFAARGHSEGGLFVTVQDTGGDFGLQTDPGLRAWLGGIGALAKTAALEWPKASVKAIDLQQGKDKDAQLAERLLDELFGGGPEVEVGLPRDGRRLSLRSVAEETVGTELPDIDKDSVILVSGGAKGVTAHTLIALAKEASPRFVLLGRSPLLEEPAYALGLTDNASLQKAALAAAKAAGEKITPKELAGRVRTILGNREIQGTLQALKDAGSEAIYLAIDIRDKEALGKKLDEIRESWGEITGVVHGAGVLADAWLHKKTPEQFERVFSTKIGGLCTLLDLTRQDPLSFICLFSSVSARVGNPGQSDYAMANEILNKVAVAEAQSREASVVKSMDWGPWEGGMVTPQLKQLFEQRGITLIPLDTGARCFVDELRDDSGHVEVVIGGAVSPEGLQGDSAEATGTTMEAWVHQSSYPFLDSHRVQGDPVLPVVLVLEWFTRLAQAAHPGYVVSACKDLKVLKGIRLEHFETTGHIFRVRCIESQPGQVQCSLESLDGTAHYSATVELGTELQSPKGIQLQSPELSPSPWSHDELYDAEHTLFHGPAFQVIDDLKGVAAEGGEARLLGTSHKAWPGGPWSTDPAALDGSLQLALLWGLEQMKHQTLPMRIGQYIPYTTKPSSDPMRCVLRKRKVSSLRTVSDLLLLGSDGEPIAALEEVEMISMPSH